MYLEFFPVSSSAGQRWDQGKGKQRTREQLLSWESAVQRLRPGVCRFLSLNQEPCYCPWTRVLTNICSVPRRRSWRSRGCSTRVTDFPWLQGTRWTPRRCLQTCLLVWVSTTYAGVSWTEPRGSTPSPEPFSPWVSWCLTCCTGSPIKFYGTRTCWPHCDDAHTPELWGCWIPSTLLSSMKHLPAGSLHLSHTRCVVTARPVFWHGKAIGFVEILILVKKMHFWLATAALCITCQCRKMEYFVCIYTHHGKVWFVLRSLDLCCEYLFYWYQGV